jgi:hypothetical protein
MGQAGLPTERLNFRLSTLNSQPSTSRMNWYFALDGHSHGPISEKKLEELARSGEVTTDTLIWHPGLEEWEPVWKLKAEIVEQLNKRAMAQQAKGTTDRVPVADVSADAATADGASEGIFQRFFGKLKKK